MIMSSGFDGRSWVPNAAPRWAIRKRMIPNRQPAKASYQVEVVEVLPAQLFVGRRGFDGVEHGGNGREAVLLRHAGEELLEERRPRDVDLGRTHGRHLPVEHGGGSKSR